jgi:hypothetical protein
MELEPGLQVTLPVHADEKLVAGAIGKSFA